MFDWNDLRYFLAVARAGTLAGAARELGVEHTTVGRRLSALEAALGAKLFRRGPEGFTLTDAGADMLPLAEQVARSVDAIERRAAGDDGRVEGTVRLTVSEALSGYLVKRLGALRELHPALVVEVLVGNRMFDLMRGEADIAVRVVDKLKEPDLVARKLAVAGWALYASPSYFARKGTPCSAEALAGHDVVELDATMRGVPGSLWLEAHGKGANVVARANSIVAALNTAIAGMGIAAVPCSIGDAEPAVRRVSPRIIGSRDVFLLVHPDLARVARVRAVVDFVVECFRRDARLWSGQREDDAAS